MGCLKYVDPYPPEPSTGLFITVKKLDTGGQWLVSRLKVFEGSRIDIAVIPGDLGAGFLAAVGVYGLRKFPWWSFTGACCGLEVAVSDELATALSLAWCITWQGGSCGRGFRKRR